MIVQHVLSFDQRVKCVTFARVLAQLELYSTFPLAIVPSRPPALHCVCQNTLTYKGLKLFTAWSKDVSFLLKSPIVVMGNSFHQVHFGPRDAAYGPVPVVSDPHVKVSGVKVLKILVEGHKVLHMDELRGHNEEEQRVAHDLRARDWRNTSSLL